VALLAMLCMAPSVSRRRRATAGRRAGRSVGQLLRQPAFWWPRWARRWAGVMNLLMAATPLAMQVCGFAFDDAALVLEWHVIGMFAPGFFTGHLIKRWARCR
jgi:hypothetical protein